jgi:hypothetical protein
LESPASFWGLGFSILGVFEEGVNRFEERLLLDGGRGLDES